MARRVDTALLRPQKGSRQGGMTSHRTTLLILTLLAVIQVAVPSVAAAGALLGGYGGPGEGNQAILGSSLLNGTGGGSGGGSSGSTPSTAGSRAGRGSVAPTGPSGHASHPGGRSHAGGTSSSREGASVGGAGTYSVRPLGQTSPPVHDGAEPLGLSGVDLLYILLALVVLACTGVLTWRLTRTFSAPNAHNS
jgi:hypothetical protein